VYVLTVKKVRYNVVVFHSSIFLFLFFYLFIYLFICCYWGGIRVKSGTGLVVWVGLKEGVNMQLWM